MGHSYPIWVDVVSNGYQSSKSYGIKNSGTQNIYVGSSAADSNYFAYIGIHKYGNKFMLSVDGKVIKIAEFKDGKLKIKSKIKQIKSL